MNKLLLLLLIPFSFSHADLPDRPRNADHPGSSAYSFTSKKETLEIDGRRVDLYFPKVTGRVGRKFPVLVFGHGQALDHEHYEKSFQHFAKKGVFVIHPMYDRGFFDRRWDRMANDFNQLTTKVLNRLNDLVNREKVVYSGHSKGAFVALLAATKETEFAPKSLVLFAPAKNDKRAFANIDPGLPISMIWAGSDGIIDEKLTLEIFNSISSNHKQLIKLSDYPELEAGHFYLLTKKTLFGGQDEPGPYHYHGMWKWVLGAIEDLNQGSGQDNPYLYGSQSLTSGSAAVFHQRL